MGVRGRAVYQRLVQGHSTRKRIIQGLNLRFLQTAHPPRGLSCKEPGGKGRPLASQAALPSPAGNSLIRPILVSLFLRAKSHEILGSRCGVAWGVQEGFVFIGWAGTWWWGGVVPVGHAHLTVPGARMGGHESGRRGQGG